MHGYIQAVPVTMPFQRSVTMVFLKKYFIKNPFDDINLREAFKPLYIILSIFGLFPYSMSLQDEKKGFSIIPKSIYLNFLCAAFNIFIIIFFLVLHIQQLLSSVEHIPLTEGILTQMNYITELCTLNLFCVVTYISVYLNRFKCLDIMNRLSAMFDAPNINSRKVLNRLLFLSRVMLIGPLGILLILQLTVNFTRNDSLNKMILVAFSFNHPQMIQFTALAYFCFLVIILVHILMNLRVQILTSSAEKIVTSGVTKMSMEHGSLTLRQTTLVYIETLELKKCVNKIFEAPILVMLMQCFHSIVSESHIIYHGVVVQKNLRVHDIINCSIWIGYQILKLYGITSAGNAFNTESLKLSQAIHIIPTEKQDLRFFLEVQRLSSIMALPVRELTVYGYFTLDASLMFKVIASATIFVIMLVQFDNSS